MNIPCRLTLCLLILALTMGVAGRSLAQTAPWDIEKLPSTKAPGFSLPDLTGKVINVTAFGDKVLLINFWATWCAPCRQEMPALDRLQRQFAGQGLAVIGISIDSDGSLLKKFIEDAKIQFPILHDPSLKCPDEYKVSAYPTTFLVDSKGVIQKYWIGPQEWESKEFKKILQSYLPKT